MIVNIQVMRTCNLRCTFCSHDKWKDPTGQMEYVLFETIIESLNRDKCSTVCFVSAQGESLLHPRIFDMLALARATFAEVNLCTNGTPLNEKRIAKLVALNLDSIQFSFAGWDKKSYERVYAGGKFEQVSRNLKGLIAAMKGTRTTLSINGICENADSFAPTLSYLISLGASHNQIRLRLLHNWGGTIGEKATGPVTMCPLLVSTPGIYIDGRVTACGCIDANGALEIGNIKEHDIMALREGPKYQAMLAAFNSGDVSGLPLCRDCEIPRKSPDAAPP